MTHVCGGGSIKATRILVLAIALSLASLPAVRAESTTGMVMLCSQPVALPLSLLLGVACALVSYLIFPGIIGWILGMLIFMPLQVLFDARAHYTEGVPLWEIIIDVILAFCYAGAIEILGGFILGFLVGQAVGMLLSLPFSVPAALICGTQVSES